MCAKTLNLKSRAPVSATANRRVARIGTVWRREADFLLEPGHFAGFSGELSFLFLPRSMTTRSRSPGLDKSKTRSNLSQLVSVGRNLEKKKSEPTLVSLSGEEHVMDAQEQSTPVYKLYRRRWLGLGMCLVPDSSRLTALTSSQSAWYYSSYL